MFTRLFTSFFLIASTSIFAQVPKFYESTPRGNFYKMQPKSLEGKLYEIGKPRGFSYLSAAGNVRILALDSLLNYVDDISIWASDYVLDSLNNFITFYGANHGGDFTSPTLNFEFKRFNSNFEQLENFSFNEFPNTFENELFSNGKILQIDDEHVLIFLAEKRVVFNIYTFEIVSHYEDVPFGVIDKIEWIDNNRILINDIQKDSFYLADSTGIIYDSLSLGFANDWIWHEGFLWMSEGKNLTKRNELFEIVDIFEYDFDLYNFQIGNNNELLLGSVNKILKISNGVAEPEVIYETNHDKERIYNAFYFQDELYFQGPELKPFPLLQTGTSTTRRAIPLDFEQLPNMAVELIDTYFIPHDPMDLPGDFSIRFNVEVENKGEIPIESFAYLATGPCADPPWSPDYCSRSRVQDLNILPGEKQLVSIWTGLYNESINFNYEIDIKFYNPNYQYDSDYSDNSLTGSAIYTSTNNINIQDEIKVFPNPTLDLIQITFNSEKRYNCIKIFNTIGQLVGEFETESNTETQSLDVSNLTPGSYSIIAHGKNNFSIAKFLKQ